jgi:predicted metal-dependent hydrolase
MHAKEGHPLAEDQTRHQGDLVVEVIRSGRRTRTYKWSFVADRVRLEVPAGLRGDDEARIVEDVRRRAQRRLAHAGRASDESLLLLARELARRLIPDAQAKLRSVSWSDRQEHRWGSCSVETGAIRVSTRLHGLPRYVLEAVLVHEIAHLVERNHSPRFHALANTYPLAERARGFLEAVDRQLLQSEPAAGLEFD